MFLLNLSRSLYLFAQLIDSDYTWWGMHKILFVFWSEKFAFAFFLLVIIFINILNVDHGDIFELFMFVFIFGILLFFNLRHSSAYIKFLEKSAFKSNGMWDINWVILEIVREISIYDIGKRFFFDVNRASLTTTCQIVNDHTT